MKERREIYLMSRFTFGGEPSYALPLCGFSLAERVLRAYPAAKLYLDEKRGENGENLLGISLKSLTDYPFVRRRLQQKILLDFLRRGVLIEDLDSVYIEDGVTIEPGVKIGHVFGLKFKAGAEIAGGVVLILMGLKILLEHLGVFGSFAG